MAWSACRGFRWVSEGLYGSQSRHSGRWRYHLQFLFWGGGKIAAAPLDRSKSFPVRSTVEPKWVDCASCFQPTAPFLTILRFALANHDFHGCRDKFWGGGWRKIRKIKISLVSGNSRSAASLLVNVDRVSFWAGCSKGNLKKTRRCQNAVEIATTSVVPLESPAKDCGIHSHSPDITSPALCLAALLCF